MTGLVSAIGAFVILVLFGGFVIGAFLKGVGQYEREIFRHDKD